VITYICPACRAPLAAQPQALVCGGCTARYPVVDGIARFVPPENYSGSFGLQWNRHQRTQLDSHIGRPISRQRLFATTGWPERLEGQTVLEAGSGAGRFTEVLCSTGARVFSFDYSSAVEANARNNGRAPGLTLFQGDIRRIPLPEQAFDHVLCLGVLQHTPNPRESFLSLVRHVRPGGDLVVDVYRDSLAARLQWKYLLRPVTKRLPPATLYRAIAWLAPKLMVPTRWLRRLFGRAGARLSPIVEYSHLGLSPEHNREWAVLDTFDMYAPAYDLPQTAATLRSWYAEAGFVDVVVGDGPNGVAGRGRRPLD
jgi:SAM-dependent methyltransferase